ncbi:hypothetical protein F5888DRAFT_1621859 [Russula emetica]|nr:hypothetical protein F5888DRAFT_1621859 [Russula emetica]
MSNPSNALTVGSLSQIGAAAPSGPATSSSAPRARAPANVITYSYASRLVYVAPAETYDDAIDIAKESFRELSDVERERISFEIKVNLPKTHESRTAEIGRTAWPMVVASLARFEIVEIRITPFSPETAMALSSSQASAVEPPPYALEKSGYSDSQTNVAPAYGPQIPSSQSPSSPSLITRIVNFLTPKSSRSRLFP